MKGSLFLNKTYSRNELKGLMESILFVNGKTVSLKELTDIFEMPKKEISEMIEEMNEEYNQRHSGLNIVPVAGGFQMVSNPVYKDELQELFGKRNQNQLTRSSMETLAVVAYKQPISKEEIDRIRGVSSTRSVNVLLGYKLITISGTTDDMVKSPVYSTTKRFLEMFHLQSMEELPSIENINLFDLDMVEDVPEEEDAGEEEELTLSLNEP